MKAFIAVVLIVIAVVDSEFQRPSNCMLESDIGMCDGYFVRYFYNVTSDACDTFTYGGCGGNENRFQTEKACKKTCKNE
ncbi:Uncharacterised protein g1854 [Pycnogonum litorale]